MSCFNDFSGCQLVALAGVLACSIADGLNSDEIDTLGNFFSALGYNLSVIVTSSPSKDSYNKDISK